MRPKKRILLIDTDEERRGHITFVLRCHSYAILLPPLSVPDDPVDLTIVTWPAKSERECHEIYIRSGFPVLLLKPHAKELAGVFTPYGYELRGAFTNSDLLERIAILCTRKRGPRKAVPTVARQVAS